MSAVLAMDPVPGTLASGGTSDALRAVQVAAGARPQPSSSGGRDFEVDESFEDSEDGPLPSLPLDSGELQGLGIGPTVAEKERPFAPDIAEQILQIAEHGGAACRRGSGLRS